MGLAADAVTHTNKRMNEREKMENGLWHDANFDAQLLAERQRAKTLCHALNAIPPDDETARKKGMAELFPHIAEDVMLLSPVFCDYGGHIHIGAGSFINHGCYFMDGARITLGKNVFIGPGCGFYTATHPLDADERNAGLEQAKPITLGDNVWLGGNVIVLPGVTIGTGSVIGAGRVVTKDVPPGTLAFGNPCRPRRPITAADKIQR